VYLLPLMLNTGSLYAHLVEHFRFASLLNARLKECAVLHDV
jgi:hypothetical protein